MTQTDTHSGPRGSGGLDDAVAAITGPVARRLTVRYLPVYAAVAVMLLVAAVAPSRVDAGGLAPAPDFGPTSDIAASGGDASTATDTGSEAGTSPQASFTPVPVPAPSAKPSLPEPAVLPDPVAGPGQGGETSGGLSGPDPGDFAGDPGEEGDGSGGFSGASACPVEFGQEPEVSRGVAGVLLSAASPALSLLGPFGPNAVPALGLASPLLPIVAPVADKLAPYISLLNPLFLQVSELGTMLWQGPLQPLEGPLLQLNAAVVQPLEVELLAALAGPIEQLNATPLTPCLQRLVYNLVAPLPIPTP